MSASATRRIDLQWTEMGTIIGGEIWEGKMGGRALKFLSIRSLLSI